MPNATVRAAARTLPEAATRRAALGAIIAAGAAGATVVLPAATSRAIAASVPYEDAALFALLTEARAIDMLQNEVDDAENAAYDRIIWPDRPSALNPRPGDHFLVRSRRAEFDEPDIRELRGLVEGMEKLGQDTKIINQALVREIKTRGREIVDAWESYRADRDRAQEAAGLPAIDCRWKELNERRVRLWSLIAQTPARTVEGMHAKIAFAVSFELEREDLVEGTMQDILVSAAMDYADLHGQEARA
jgi:hypothetical protein